MRVLKNISLKPYNTFGLEVKTDFFTKVTFEKDLTDTFDFIQQKKLPFLMLGGGSNILFVNDFKGVVLLNVMKGITLLQEDNDKVMVRVSGGESWPGFVDYCVRQGWSGVENLSLIPGTVGAAPIQNIGAYGTEVKDVIRNVEVWEPETGNTKTLFNTECRFGYRSSIFKTKHKGKYIITAVTFGLSKKFIPKLNYKPLKEMFSDKNIRDITLQEISNAVKTIRRSKLPDPEVLGNTGSFFKNPEVKMEVLEKVRKDFEKVPFYDLGNGKYKIPAGWLIEQAGWKGKRQGDAGVHEKQALVLVNYGKATGKEILDLATQIKDSVLQKFGVKLEFEVNIVG
jgi:UDP-N-acetylmuramate dehydrogenase